MAKYVLKSEFDQHLTESKEGFDRLTRVEDEIVGNHGTGRPSLRQEFTDKLELTTIKFESDILKIENSVEAIRKIIKRIGLSVIILIAGRYVVDFIYPILFHKQPIP